MKVTAPAFALSTPPTLDSNIGATEAGLALNGPWVNHTDSQSFSAKHGNNPVVQPQSTSSLLAISNEATGFNGATGSNAAAGSKAVTGFNVPAASGLVVGESVTLPGSLAKLAAGLGLQPGLSTISNTAIVATKCQTEERGKVNCAPAVPEISSLAEDHSSAALTDLMSNQVPFSSSIENVNLISIESSSVLSNLVPLLQSGNMQVLDLVKLDAAREFWGADSSYMQTQLVPSAVGDPQSVPVPEPSSLALFGAGLIALGIFRRRRHS